MCNFFSQNKITLQPCFFKEIGLTFLVSLSSKEVLPAREEPAALLFLTAALRSSSRQ